MPDDLQTIPHQTPAMPRRGLFVMALITACAMGPLVFVGAGVTSKEAGMAYTDGFTSAGYFLQNPPGWWEADDTRWEHGHRLLGRTVGLLAMALAVWCWSYGGHIRRLGLINLVAICVQGALGAFRVYEVSTFLAMIHGIFGQLCFCLTCIVALVVSRAWHNARIQEVHAERFLKHLGVAVVGVVLIQLATGAAARHFSGSVTLMAHIFWAMVVFFVSGWLVMWILTTVRRGHPLAFLAKVLGVLLVVQLLLGASSFVVTMLSARWSSSLIWLVPSLHVVGGALLLVCTVLLALCAFRFLRPAPGKIPVVVSEAVTAT